MDDPLGEPFPAAPPRAATGPLHGLRRRRQPPLPRPHGLRPPRPRPRVWAMEWGVGGWIDTVDRVGVLAGQPPSERGFLFICNVQNRPWLSICIYLLGFLPKFAFFEAVIFFIKLRGNEIRMRVSGLTIFAHFISGGFYFSSNGSCCGTFYKCCQISDKTGGFPICERR